MITSKQIDYTPKIIRTNQLTTITVTSLGDGKSILNGHSYQVLLYPLEESGSHPTSNILTVTAQDECLHLPVVLANEQEYFIKVREVDKADEENGADLHLYALADDLFYKKPYRGDLHIHSCRSDGKEPPAFVAAACRSIGLDFMAVTDHHLYSPSLEAIRSYANIPIDLHIFPGEEIHPPENNIHMINFGGNTSINDMFHHGRSYRASVKLIEKELTDIPNAKLRYQYASCLWCYQQIRAAGGLGIFCHPYWKHNHTYNVPESLIARHFVDLPFDAFEVIGGYRSHELESNRLQVARYYEERSQGKYIPIVGVSDAHGCYNEELFGWYSTIVFSVSADLVDLTQNIKQLHSVALETLPGSTPHIHGPFRLVRYAHFLLREIFPRHDELCAEEGRLMKLAIEGNSEAAGQLRLCQGQTNRLYDRLWGST